MNEEQAERLIKSVRRIEVIMVGFAGAVIVGGLLVVLDMFFNFI